MNFPNKSGGLRVDLSDIPEDDVIRILMSENPGVIIQTSTQDHIKDYLLENGVEAVKIGEPVEDRILEINQYGQHITSLPIDELRDIWYETSYLLDSKQSGEELALQRFSNYKKQPLSFVFPSHFKGKLTSLNIEQQHRPSGVKAAIIREKGVNGDREMAYSMYLAGMDVKDIHMTDLVSGRETLEDVNMIVFVGGFSNSDVLGSAKGWAGAFLYNPKAKKALDRFYNRPDTLSLGICNGCQLMIHLGLITPGHDVQPTMHFNDTGKFESAFLNVDIPENNSVMLKSLTGSRLGIWIAHGEGKFKLPYDESQYTIPVKYSYSNFPGNPNGSDLNTAGLCSPDGRHLAMMPHLERSVLPWQWAYYPSDRKAGDEVSPWIEAFVNAKNWIEETREKKKL
jgi:phosphoribosylformylglycinamidine synthase